MGKEKQIEESKRESGKEIVRDVDGGSEKGMDVESVDGE